MPLDWISHAAKEIAARTSNVQRPGAWFKTLVEAEAWAREVIERFYPFEPDVAYMPVPRCESCKHWDPLRAPGDCRVLLVPTPKDFGCVRWETK